MLILFMKSDNVDGELSSLEFLFQKQWSWLVENPQKIRFGMVALLSSLSSSNTWVSVSKAKGFFWDCWWDLSEEDTSSSPVQYDNFVWMTLTLTLILLREPLMMTGWYWPWPWYFWERTFDDDWMILTLTLILLRENLWRWLDDIDLDFGTFKRESLLITGWYWPWPRPWYF